jgi:outer membrane protein assembly factor BamB
LFIGFNALTGVFTPNWERPLEFGPNGTSMDDAAQFIAASDGAPYNSSQSLSTGNFYLFDRAGNPIWQFPTGLMNWPVAVSADGTAVAGGSDDGTVYYFDTVAQA